MENLQIEKRTVKDTEVFIGRKIIKEILPRIRSVFEEGALFVVYEEEQKDVAEALMQELKRGGYRVFAGEASTFSLTVKGYDFVEIPEYIRFVIAVGDSKAYSVAKSFAAQRNVDWSLFMCAPSSDEMMCGICPKQVFIDSEIIDKSPKEQIAAGYGIVLTTQFRAFEDGFANKVLSNNKHIQSIENGAPDLTELAFLLIRISSEKDGTDSAERMAKILTAKALSQGKKPRLLGEYRFLCACVITAFYSAFLGAPSIDAMPPACRDDALDKLASLPFEKTVNGSKCVDFFDINGYFKINYILGEYRMDLLEKLANIDVHGMQRFWRRLYPDAGYWLKNEISAKEMLEVLALAGAKSDNLLGYAYASGILKKIG